MAAQAVVQPQAFALSRRAPRLLASYILLVIVATVPRMLDLGQFVTEDEANFWFTRSATFLYALQTGNFAATAITDHPGVTTMWLGSAGMLLLRALHATGMFNDPSIQAVLAVLRLPTALTHAAAVILGYALLRRQLPGNVAWLGALLWAADPFVVGYSRLLHVDALAGSFATLSVLAACCYWFDAPRSVWLGLSAVSAALAMLSKSPAIVLIPAVFAIAVLATWEQDGTAWRVARILRPFGIWLILTAVTTIVAWPALWVNPMAAYHQIQLGIIGEGMQPHELGNFFRGQLDPAPGLLFYPVTLALRLTPLTLIGILLLPWAWRRIQTHATARQSLAALACYILLFTLAMSVFPKKFNRYLVPVFPALDVLAAAGIVWSGARLDTTLRRVTGLSRQYVRRSMMLAYGSLAGLALINAAQWHPYDILAFNQLLGGPATGVWAFTVGWGEGLEQVAAWLNQQPDITGVLTVTTMKPGLQTYLKPGAQAASPPGAALPDQTGYVVVYRQQAQMQAIGPPFDQFYGRVTPLHTIRIHGIDYAWIYQAPPHVSIVRSATWEAGIALYGYKQASAPQRGQPLPLQLVWNPNAAPPTGTMLFTHLRGPDGQTYARADLPYPPPNWQAQRWTIMDVPLQIPADAPAGVYRLTIGLYDQASGQRLRLMRAPPEAAEDGPDAVLLGEVTLR